MRDKSHKNVDYNNPLGISKAEWKHDCAASCFENEDGSKGKAFLYYKAMR